MYIISSLAELNEQQNVHINSSFVGIIKDTSGSGLRPSASPKLLLDQRSMGQLFHTESKLHLLWVQAFLLVGVCFTLKVVFFDDKLFFWNF